MTYFSATLSCSVADELLRKDAQSGVAGPSTTSLMDPPDADILVMRTVNGPDWHTLGMRLNLSLHELSEIRETCKKPADRRKVTFRRWLVKEHDPTWAKVITCFRSLGVHGIANELERDYKRKLLTLFVY